MNHFHRVIFNPSLGVRQVVSEIASSGRGAGSQASTGSASRMPRLSALAAACLLAWCAMPQAQAASCAAATSTDLANCINTANVDTINLTNSITLGANLGVIDRNITINGNGNTLSGADTYRGFFVGAGIVTVNDLTLQNLRAKGGNGGDGYAPGGGGMGAGGAVFVRDGAAVTLNNVSINNNQATGGNGGGRTTGLNAGLGGGGGMGGNGGGTLAGANDAGRGGGGLFGDGGYGTSFTYAGGADGGPNGGAAGNGISDGGPGGLYGGGGGSSAAGTAITAGGDGGFGGGGGGGIALNLKGGSGGFGGGGGGSGFIGGAGGFGGGGGGAFGGETTTPGAGGFAGGIGGTDSTGGVSGGGGAGMGGAVFVMSGGSLIIGENTRINGNSVTGGAAGTGTAGAGSAFGSGIFLQGSGAHLTFSPASGTQTVADVIADQSGSGGTGANAGSIGITKTGAGTTILSGANTYTGGTTLSDGVLSVSSNANLGDAAGKLFFDAGTLQTTGNITMSRATTLLNGGTISTDAGTTLTHDGVIDGTGGLTKTGAGTLVLTNGNNTYLGTSIRGGTLSISADEHLGARSLLTLEGGTLRTTGAFTTTRVVNLEGSGGTFETVADLTATAAIFGSNGAALTKTGVGTLTLSGSNTYTGGTHINAGVLSVGSDSNLGAASGSVTLGGGTFKNTAAITTGRTFYANASNSTFQTDADLVITAQVQGNGNLIKTGAATLVLANNSAYAGNTTISAGTLQVGNGGASGRTSFGPITNNATLAFNRSDNDFIDSNPISGSGNVVQKGTGTLILAGTNTYRGGTSLNAGVTSVFADSNLGDATGALTFNGGALQTTAAFTTARTITLNAGSTIQTGASLEATGVIGGAGSLAKTGTGNLILSGANTYTGATTVNAGTLSVNGSITSDTTVNSGGALGGSGTVRNVLIASGGTLAPGNSIGTLTVNGNLTFAPGSVYRVETDAAGNADRIFVVGAPGTLTINGGTVDVRAGAGNYARNTNYTILTSTGATTGTFTGVTSNLAFLTPSLSYLPNGVTLNLLAGNAPVYNTVAQTPNQTSVANYLSNFANTPGNAGAAALIQQIDNLTAEQARTAFDSMSGSPHAAASQIAGALGRNFSSTLATRNGSTGSIGLSNSGSSTVGLKAPQYAALSPALLTRLGDVVNDSPLRVSAADPSGEAQDRPTLQSVGGLWGQAMGTGGRTGSDGNGAASRYRANGFVFGYDQPITSNWLAGAALAYNKTQWDASTNGVAPASGSINSPQAGLYARYTDGPWQVRLDGTYSDHRFSTDRTITIGNASSIARSSHGGTEWGFAAQAEYAIHYGDWEARPLAGLRHARLSEAGFTETGAGAASLTVDARRTQNTVASLGMKFIRPLDPSKADTGTLELRAIASHLMGDNDSPLSSRLAGQPASFTAAGTPLKRTALTLGATLTGQLARALSAYADAAYEYRGAGQNAFLFTAGLRMSW